ncbi:MAG: hypothetical protein ACE5KE_09890 [Methanosarcinales archaeon]
MSKLPFNAYIDNRIVEAWHQYVEGRKLSAQVLPQEKWPEKLLDYVEGDITLSLFVIPYNKNLDIDGLENEQIGKMKGETVDMGEFPNLRFYKQNYFKIGLEKGQVYDVLATGKSKKTGNRQIFGGGRLLTKKVEKIPYPITLEEMKFLAIEDLGLTPEQAKGIKAKITPMTGWGNRRRFIIAGFDFGEMKAGWNAGVMVQHNGYVSHYHGYSTEELLKFLFK